jgi:nicotinamidase-related amidase
MVYKTKKLKHNKATKTLTPLHVNLNRVLIVVDVQNCFFDNFGTMGWLPKNYNNSIEMNKQRDNIKHKFVSKLQTFIESVKSKYDIIIFTKDRHPIGHRSFGTYPPHCINVSKTCKINYIQDSKKNKNQALNIVDISGKKKSGHRLINSNSKSNSSIDLEEILYDYKISYNGDINDHLDITKLKDLDLNGQIKYEKTKSRNEKTSVIKLDSIKFMDHSVDNSAIIVRLNKGELCNFDAYGAFVYHVEYNTQKCKLSSEVEKTKFVDIYNSKLEYNPCGETNILSVLDEFGDITKLSTGLAEFLLQYYNNKFAQDMVIDVCGLVTNICVVNTCVGGVKLFENIKKHKLKDLHIPHFRILNQYSLYLYVFPLSEMDILNQAHIKYTIYKNETEYSKSNSKANKVSIISESAVDGYKPIRSEVPRGS